MESEFARYLKRSGRKLTGERRKIADAALSFHGHFDIEELFDRLKSGGSRISRATIYRAIPLLVESLFVRSLLKYLFCRSKNDWFRWCVKFTIRVVPIH